MSLKIFYFSFVIMLSVVILSGCTSTKKEDSNMKFYTGSITVVGNEPFTSLALMVSEDETYLLECDDELSAQLSKEQGKLYKIGYITTEKKERGIVLLVENAEPISE